ncbi:MAG: type IX secretion system sortase PorU, partial [Myroides sp.]
MKRLLPVFAFLGFYTVNAQTKDVQLQWTEQTITISSEESFFVPSFQQEYFRYNSSEKIVRASAYINNVQGDQVRIVSQNLQAIDISKYKDINPKNIPATVNPTVRIYTTKGVRSAIVDFNPIVKTGSGYSKVTNIVFEVFGGRNNQAKDTNFTIQNSVLAQGSWYKFKVNETGVYRLDRNFFAKLGIPNDVDPRTIKVYGYGGDMLPLANSKNLYFDLPEVAIQFQGEQDGTLNDADYALFYAVGTKGWSEENATHLNLYSNDAYYYVTYGGTVGKRMQTYIEPAGTATVNYTDYVARSYDERNIENIVQLSRKTFGENFGQSFNKQVVLQTPMLNSSKPAKIGVNVAAISQNQSSFNIALNNQQIGTRSVNGKSSSVLGGEGYFSHEMNLNSETNNFTISFNNNGVPSARGFIDFVAIDYYKHLAGYNKQFKFNFADAVSQVGVGSFQINSAQSITQVWDVTDRYNATFKPNAASTISFKMPLGELREYVAVDQNDFYAPADAPNPKVVNQNLKGTILSNGNVDYIIITTNELVSAANRLANLHKAQSNLNVKVVPLDAIYNEFSSGQQDIVAIRNFIRYVYFAGNQTLKYVNLMGDASTNYFDTSSNLVPIFHYLNTDLSASSSQNFNDWSTFATDDFYALLDETEGAFSNQNYKGIDVSVGRMPVTNIQEANSMISKIEQYLSKDNAGRWKNVYTALADDVDSGSDVGLQVAINDMADELVESKPYFNVKKVIADSYQQQVVAGGPRYPKAKEDFLNGINNGSLVASYLGHGSATGLGGERYFEIPDIEKLTNTDKYPLFVIMTCDFTRFDDPSQKSGGEFLYLRDKSGAIGIYATTRKIGISNAQEVTKVGAKWLFDYDNTLPNLTMAEALMNTKNENVS